jgi:hypothetical protein
METTQIAEEQPLALIEKYHRPYPPSWVDRLNDWVSRVPGPAWAFYLGIWLLLILIEGGGKWLDGVEPSFKLRWIYVLYSFYGVYFLAAIHYLDAWAKTAFAAFRPALAAGEAEQSLLLFQLTTMPARTVWLLSAGILLSQILLYRPLLVPLWEAMGFSHYSIAGTLVDFGIFAFNAISVGIFIYHSLRQLGWISRIHKTATRINLFQLRPLYSLSGLTARTAGILLLVGLIIEQQVASHGVMTSDPYALWMSELFMFVTFLAYSLLAVAAFFLPLVGLHNLLVREKERLQAEADSRLKAHIQELHQRVDARKLKDADSVYFQLSSLNSERDILAKLPTWPWQPGTLNLILSAVLLPVVLWIVQQLLERWVGF